MIVKLLTEHHLELLSFKGGCTGLYESTLVKMPHCWKSHATARIIFFGKPHNIYNGPSSPNCIKLNGKSHKS